MKKQIVFIFLLTLTAYSNAQTTNASFLALNVDSVITQENLLAESVENAYAKALEWQSFAKPYQGYEQADLPYGFLDKYNQYLTETNALKKIFSQQYKICEEVSSRVKARLQSYADVSSTESKTIIIDWSAYDQQRSGFRTRLLEMMTKSNLLFDELYAQTDQLNGLVSTN